MVVATAVAAMLVAAILVVTAAGILPVTAAADITQALQRWQWRRPRRPLWLRRLHHKSRARVPLIERKCRGPH